MLFLTFGHANHGFVPITEVPGPYLSVVYREK